MTHTRTHPHKNPFLLNFVFCFILLFSLNTSLKSVCTSDVDMGGYWLLNVDTIKYTPHPLIINGVQYLNPLVNQKNFPSTSESCPPVDGKEYYLILTTQTAVCPAGTTLIEYPTPLVGTFPTIAQLEAAFGAAANTAMYYDNTLGGLTCATTHIYVLVNYLNQPNLFLNMPKGQTVIYDDAKIATRAALPLCRLDDQS